LLVLTRTASTLKPALTSFSLKNFLRALKRSSKEIVKVVKKIAPIVLPIALGMFGPLGVIYGSALGSGIGTLISGGSLKDALKAGVMAGVTGGLVKGVGGMLPGGQGFFKSIGTELAAPGARFAQLGQGISNTAGNLFSAGTPNTGPGVFTKFDPALAVDAGTMTADAAKAFDPVVAVDPKQLVAARLANTEAVIGGSYETPGVMESLAKGDYKTAFLPSSNLPTAQELLAAGVDSTKIASTLATAAPNMLRSYLPGAVAATGLASRCGWFHRCRARRPRLD